MTTRAPVTWATMTKKEKITTVVVALIVLLAAGYLLTRLASMLSAKDVEDDAPRKSAGIVQYATVEQLRRLEDRVNLSLDKQDTHIKVQDEKILNIASAASAAEAAASKCASTCGGKPTVTTTQRRRHTGGTTPSGGATPRVDRPVAPTAPAASAPCNDCRPTVKVDRTVPSENGVCGIEAHNPQGKLVARFILQSHDGALFPAKTGNLHILQVSEFKLGPVQATETAVTGVKFTACPAAKGYVENNWAKVVEKFKLPNDCVPVRKS